LGPEDRHFPAVSVVTGRDFPAVTFLTLGIVKTVWVAGKSFCYQQQGFLSLIMKFSDGKLKQKGFFSQRTQGQNSRTPMRLPSVWRKQGIIPEMDHTVDVSSVLSNGLAVGAPSSLSLK
jgi:hypothetical protein